MAIVERNVSTTTTRTTRPVGDTVVVDNTDNGAGILVVLGIIVAFAAAYFLYQYYYNPSTSTMPASGTSATVNPAPSSSAMTPAEEPASQPSTTQQ